MEKTHAATLTPDMFSPQASLAVIDVSFIGLRKVLQPVVSVLERPALVVALVKPQFELGPEFVSKGGVVREEKLQMKAVELVEDLSYWNHADLSVPPHLYVHVSLQDNQKVTVPLEPGRPSSWALSSRMRALPR